MSNNDVIVNINRICEHITELSKKCDDVMQDKKLNINRNQYYNDLKVNSYRNSYNEIEAILSGIIAIIASCFVFAHITIGIPLLVVPIAAEIILPQIRINKYLKQYGETRISLNQKINMTNKNIDENNQKLKNISNNLKIQIGELLQYKDMIEQIRDNNDFDCMIKTLNNYKKSLSNLNNSFEKDSKQINQLILDRKNH